MASSLAALGLCGLSRCGFRSSQVTTRWRTVQCAVSDQDVLTVTEVYSLLKEAPSTQHALQLAARLRRAAREGKTMKDGRSLDANVVDDALDALLDNSARLRAPAAAPNEVEEPQVPAVPQDEDYADEDEEDEAFEEAYRQIYGGKAPFEDEGLGGQFEDVAEYEGEGFDGDESAYGEDREDEYMDPRDGEEAPEDSAPAVTNEDAPVTGKVSDVPEELREQIICRKFNVVDRVWKAPTAVTLPKAPALEEDAMLPENSWMRLPHIAVNGMTNCGKSTLINHILNFSYAAKASSVPGRTKSIDFYCINNRFVLVDLPGYPDPEELAHQGVLKKWEAHWEDLVLTYLQMCVDGQYDLRLMLQLQATTRRPSRACRRFVNELKKKDLPLLLILTKDDQLKKPNEERNYFATQIKKTLGLEGQHLHYTSKGALAMSRRSKKHLHKWIKTAVTAKDGRDVKQIMQEAWQSRRILETKKTPEEMQQKKERYKAYYKALREEKKKKKALQEKQAEAQEDEASEKPESAPERIRKVPKLRIRVPPRTQKIDAEIDAEVDA